MLTNGKLYTGLSFTFNGHYNPLPGTTNSTNNLKYLMPIIYWKHPAPVNARNIKCVLFSRAFICIIKLYLHIAVDNRWYMRIFVFST